MNDIVKDGTSLYWKEETIHSISAPNSIDGVFNLPLEFEMGRDDLVEVVYFCDASKELEIFIDGQKGTVFSLGQTITIKSSTRTFSLVFELLSGEGDFLGHISYSNRPNQIVKSGLDAFDWKICLRTLRRSSKCVIYSCLTDA
jgi:hypothetical protein